MTLVNFLNFVINCSYHITKMEGNNFNGVEGYGKRNPMIWTPLMDEALLDVLDVVMHQQEKGNKQNEIFISQNL